MLHPPSTKAEEIGFFSFGEGYSSWCIGWMLFTNFVIHFFFSIALLFRCNTRLCCPSQGKDFVTLLLFPLRHAFLVIFLVNFWLQPSRPGIQPSFVQIPTSAAQSTFDSSRGVTSPRGGLVHCLFASSSDGANSEWLWMLAGYLDLFHLVTWHFAILEKCSPFSVSFSLPFVLRLNLFHS